MPTFTQVECKTDIDFEVFCGTCGAGLCNNSDTRNSRNRNYPQVTVDACEKCMENAKDEGIEEGRADRDEELAELQARIDELEKELNDIQPSV